MYERKRNRKENKTLSIYRLYIYIYELRMGETFLSYTESPEAVKWIIGKLNTRQKFKKKKKKERKKEPCSVEDHRKTKGSAVLG